MIRPAPIEPLSEVTAAEDRSLQRIEQRALIAAAAIAVLIFLGIAGVPL